MCQDFFGTVPRLGTLVLGQWSCIPRPLSQDQCPKTTIPTPVSQDHCPKITVPRPLPQDHCPKTDVPRLVSQDCVVPRLLWPKAVPRLHRPKTVPRLHSPKTVPRLYCSKTVPRLQCAKTSSVLSQDLSLSVWTVGSLLLRCGVFLEPLYRVPPLELY